MDTVSDNKKRSANWTEPERLAATELILARSESLFGKFRGASLGAKSKEATWEAVADGLNASGNTNSIRTVPEIKKMYNNVKARAKEKASQSKKTGGGPAPSLGACEQVVMDHMEKHNTAQLKGIDGGFESESACTPTGIYIAPQNPIDLDGYTLENVVEEGETIISTYTPNSWPPHTDCASTSRVDGCRDALKRKSSETSSANTEKYNSFTNKRAKEQEIDLYNLEKQRMEAEIDYFKTRKEQAVELYNLQKQVIMLQLKKMKKYSDHDASGEEL